MHVGALESIRKREHWKSIVKGEQGQHMHVGALESISKREHWKSIVKGEQGQHMQVGALEKHSQKRGRWEPLLLYPAVVVRGGRDPDKTTEKES